MVCPIGQITNYWFYMLSTMGARAKVSGYQICKISFLYVFKKFLISSPSVIKSAYSLARKLHI